MAAHGKVIAILAENTKETSTNDLAALRHRPLKFLFRFIARHKAGHAVILGCVLAAVLCSVSTQYGMKHLVDVVSGRAAAWGVIRRFPDVNCLSRLLTLALEIASADFWTASRSAKAESRADMAEAAVIPRAPAKRQTQCGHHSSFPVARFRGGFWQCVSKHLLHILR